MQIHTGEKFTAEFSPMVGQIGEFQTLWVIDEGEYCGEWAMMLPSYWPVTTASWVPSGDLEQLERITIHAGFGASLACGTIEITDEQAYLLWRSGEIDMPPREHEAYCRKRRWAERSAQIAAVIEGGRTVQRQVKKNSY